MLDKSDHKSSLEHSAKKENISTYKRVVKIKPPLLCKVIKYHVHKKTHKLKGKEDCTSGHLKIATKKNVKNGHIFLIV